jgi:hypothetical protein
MNEAVLEVYRSRAFQLANAMRLCAEDYPSYASAVALLAVHSAISYNDALHIRLTGGRPKAEDHKYAIRSTKRACERAKIDSAGLRHLERLLSAKTDISYGDRAVDKERAQILSTTAERFEKWVEENFADVRRAQ